MLTDLGFWQHALAGMAAPPVIALALALTTLLLEDVAIAAGAALAAAGTISWVLAFAAVGGGIALGDLGLYAAGAGARSLPWLRRRFIGPHSLALGEQIGRRLPSAVLLARVIPGLRLLTYTACGFLRLPLTAFTGWVVVAVSLWTAGLFLISHSLGHWLARQTGLSAPVAVALPVILFALAVPVLRRCFVRP